MEIGEKFLPIGTVVLLKGATKRLMITGFCSMEEKNKDKIWDYSGCLYPEGFIKSNEIGLFDHDQIEKVFYLGLSDKEDVAYKKLLNELLEKRKEEEKASE